MDPIEDDACDELQRYLDSFLIPQNNLNAEEVLIASEEECIEKQKDEIDVLSAVYGDDFSILPSNGEEKMLDIKIRNLFEGEASYSFVFSVNIPVMYPNTPPLFEINTLHGFKRNQIDELWSGLIEIAEDKIGQTILYDMAIYCQEFIANLQTDNVIISPDYPVVDCPSTNPETEEENISVSTFSQFKSTNRNSSVLLALQGLLDLNYKIVKIEDIRNIKLKDQFIKRARSNEKKVWVWHGTQLQNIGSIVARGLIPAGQDGVRIAHGNSYGRGVYVAKSPQLSLSYTIADNRGIFRLLLCNLIVNNNSSEYPWGFVCKDGHSILPSYAIDFACQTTKEVNQKKTELSLLMENNFEELKGQEKIDTLTCYASRHLPYGYGSASGAGFMVLEVAPHDDDDDDTSYSDYSLSFEHSRSSYQNEVHMTHWGKKEISPHNINQDKSDTQNDDSKKSKTKKKKKKAIQKK